LIKRLRSVHGCGYLSRRQPDRRLHVLVRVRAGPSRCASVSTAYRFPQPPL